MPFAKWPTVMQQGTKADERNAVVTDSEILFKVLKESLVLIGYRLVEHRLEVSEAGAPKHWLIRFIYEVER